MVNEKIIIITAPSGAGKTSITKFLLNKFPVLSFSISAATREPRINEIQNKDYYFISVKEFKDKIKNNDFAEWEMVYEGKYYGTLKSELKRIWDLNKIPVLDIDVKGAIHIEQEYSGKTLSIFIQPPSLNILKERLLGRGTDTEEAIQTRINKASYEISFSHSFDKIIVNDNLDNACKEAATAIEFYLKK